MSTASASTPLPLWLTRHLGDPVALVAATTRTAAIDMAHATIASQPKGEMTALLVGHGMQARPSGIVADLRAKFANDMPIEKDRPRNGKRLGGDEAVRRAVQAVTSAMDIPLQDLLESQARQPTAIRHQIWRTLRGRGLHLATIAAITGHDMAAVSFALKKEHANMQPDAAVMLAKVHETMVYQLERV